jgi:hypothetical protein
MADARISALTDGTTIQATDQVPVNRAGTNVRVVVTKAALSLGNVDNTSDATKNAAAATLTNKTLTAPIIATISNTGTLTLPTSTDTLVGKATTDTLTNKTLTSPVVNSPTGIVKADVGLGNVDNTSDATKNAASVTLTNKTMSGASNTFSALPASGITGVIPVANLGSGTPDGTKFLRDDGVFSVPAGAGDMVLASTQTVTGAKTFGTIGGTVGKFILAGSTSGSTIVNAAAVAGSTTLTLPGSTDTLVGKATTDTLTNKTLTSPVVNSPTGIVKADVGLGNVDNTSDATKNSASVTLTNKTLTSPILTTPDIGTPSAGTVTNLTGTASININGTVGATTPATGSFTTVAASGAVTLTAAVPQLVLGANAATKGGVKMFGNTSGDVTISPLAVAGTATALTVPAVSGGLLASVTSVATVTGTPSSSNFLRGDGTWATPAGSGTVTATGGSLTSNAVVLGAGTTDTKVVAGVTTNGTAQLVLGVNTTTLGSVKMFGNTSGDVTISPAAVAGTATALTVPAASGGLLASVTSVATVTGTPSSSTYLRGDGTWATPAGGGTTINNTQGFRLTTETGVAASTSDRTAQSTLYFTPYNGNQISLYSGSAWAVQSSAEVSLALSGLTSGKNYDVFAYNNSGTLTLELSAAWTNDNTRADAIALQDGVSVKSGTTTRRLVGTIRTTATTTTEDSKEKRFVWNADNQVARNLYKDDGSGSSTHGYSSGSWREWNGGTGGPFRFHFVAGRVIAVAYYGWVEMSGSGPGYATFSLNNASGEGIATMSSSSGSYARTGLSGAEQALLGYNFVAVTELSFGSSNYNYFRCLGIIDC